MSSLLDQNAILTLNANPKALDPHKMALASMKNVRINPEARHNFIEDRARKKNVKNIDQLFQKLNKLKENGVLDLWMEKYGPQYGYAFANSTKILKEAEEKIGFLIEQVAVATSAGAPVVPMVSTSPQIINQPPYATEKEKDVKKNKKVS